MIPADHWHANDDGTAWWVCVGDVQPASGQDEVLWELDRPCETCDGTGEIVEAHGTSGFDVTDCWSCDGTDRHTFDVTIVAGELCDEYPFRVSIVPGMVLPIGKLGQIGSRAHIVADTDFGGEPVFDYWDGVDWHNDITLPPAAKVGTWAVKLRVAS